MHANQFVSLTGPLIGRCRVAAEMLMIGVAFQESNNLWRVISIEGDDLGTLSTFMVSSTACLLKKMGLKSNAAKEFYSHIDKPYVTFAHDPYLSSVPTEVVQEMLDRRFRNPVNLI